MNQLTDYSIREVRAHNIHSLPQGPSSGALLASRTKPLIRMAFRGALNFQAINWSAHRLFRTSNRLHPFPFSRLSVQAKLVLSVGHARKNSWAFTLLGFHLEWTAGLSLGLVWSKNIWSVHFIPVECTVWNSLMWYNRIKWFWSNSVFVSFCWYRILLCCSADLKHSITIACRNILESESRRQGSRESFQPS